MASGKKAVNSSDKVTVPKSSKSELQLCKVTEMNAPELEQVTHSEIPRPKTASFTIQAAERDMRELSSKDLAVLAERERNQKSCERLCPTRRKPRDINPPPTSAELGKLISDRECDFAQRSWQYGGLAGIGMGLPALSKLYNNYRGKLPLNAGWTKGEKWSASLGTLGAFLLAAAWRNQRADQVYYNEETKKFYFRTKPVFGQPKYTEMEAGTRQKHFVSGVRLLKRQVNRLPDGFMAPTMSSGRMFPIIVTGHAKNREVIQPMFPVIPEESEV